MTEMTITPPPPGADYDYIVEVGVYRVACSPSGWFTGPNSPYVPTDVGMNAYYYCAVKTGMTPKI